MRIDTRFFDLVSAVRMRVGPSKSPSKFFGSHGTEPVSAASIRIGASLITVAGVKPFSKAAE